MMLQYKSGLDMARLLVEAEQLKTWIDGSGALMAVTQSGGFPAEVLDKPTIMAAVAEIAEFRKQSALHVMVNTLPPGVRVPVHTDTLRETAALGRSPRLERWHLPIKTNEAATFWGASHGDVRMLPGIWYGPVEYWNDHSVSNLGDEERVHLVVDLGNS